MNIVKTKLNGAVIIEPKVFGDSRGWFVESFSSRAFAEVANINFAQDNHSFSAAKGTLRGLHFQALPNPQTKLVRCTRGKILDVIVDIRRNSPTFKQWISVELSAENFKQLLVPQGFAHGFITLTDDCEVQYKVDNYYDFDCDRSVRFDDPQFGINWGGTAPILSDKDKNAPNFDEKIHSF